MLSRAWEAGASVPYPVEQTDHGLMMEFIGDDSHGGAQARPGAARADELSSAWDSCSQPSCV